MAISAAVTITSGAGDLTSDALSLSVSTNLSKAGLATAIANTTGLARKTTSAASVAAIQSVILYRADDALTNGANKVFIKNLSTTPAEYCTVFIDQEEMGRLYAGDWCFFPWSATQGTLETFVVTIGGTWVAGETWAFDGITTAAANTTVADIAAQVDAQHYPNWTTSISGAAVTFTARQAGENGVVAAGTDDAIAGDVIVQAGGGDATAVISAAAIGTRSEADIVILPSINTAMTFEHMLLHE
tara:strand:- start:1708 stop:2439 length:732 start_codon:yes stop_codon:yes gene_type:complete